jgi:hypothetical protein
MGFAGTKKNRYSDPDLICWCMSGMVISVKERIKMLQRLFCNHIFLKFGIDAINIVFIYCHSNPHCCGPARRPGCPATCSSQTY